MMTRESIEYIISQAKETSSDWVLDRLNEILAHDAEQRDEIERLQAELNGLKNDLKFKYDFDALERKYHDALDALITQKKQIQADLRRLSTGAGDEWRKHCMEG